VLIFLITLFGATINLQTSDGYVLKQYLYWHYIGISFDQWLFELKEILLFSPEYGTKGDVFSHVMSYLVGHVLRMPEQYFLFVSFVYAYFFVSAMDKLLRWDRQRKFSMLFWVILINFIAYRFIDNMQTVRTWTGLWVLFYGAVGYYQERKKKYLAVMLMAPLFHVAYFLIALPAYVVVFLRRIGTGPSFLIVLYSLSFFVNIDQTEVIQQLETTELGAQKVKGYYYENEAESSLLKTDESSNLYTRYGKFWSLPNAPHFLAWAIILGGLFSKRKMTELEIGLFSTGILMAILANLIDFIPTFSIRTMANAGIYITATSMLLVLRYETGLLFWPVRARALICLSLLTFVPYIIYTLANMLQFTSVFMIIMPIAGLFPDFNLSLREFIRVFFF